MTISSYAHCYLVYIPTSGRASNGACTGGSDAGEGAVLLWCIAKRGGLNNNNNNIPTSNAWHVVYAG